MAGKLLLCDAPLNSSKVNPQPVCSIHSIQLMGEPKTGKTTVIKAVLKHYEKTNHMNMSFQKLHIYQTVGRDVAKLQKLSNNVVAVPQNIVDDFASLNKKIQNLVSLENFNEPLQPIQQLYNYIFTNAEAADYKGWVSTFDDNACYFLDNLERICEAGYLPSDKDVVRVHSKLYIDLISATITEQTCEFYEHAENRFKAKGIKWRSIIYCVDLSDYSPKGRVDTLVAAFFRHVNVDSYSGVPIFLFFTKHDLFLKKVERIPLNTVFEDFNGTPQQYEKYIVDKFKNTALKKCYFFNLLFGDNVAREKKFKKAMEHIAHERSKSSESV